MIQYLHGIRGCDEVPLSYITLSASDLMPIAEADYSSDTYATYDKEMVKGVLIIEPGHAANSTEEDGNVYESFTGDRGKVWDLISPLLYIMDCWPHGKRTQKNHNVWKSMIPFCDHFGVQTT